MSNPLYRQHVISVADLPAQTLLQLVKTAVYLKQHPQPGLLANKLVATCFFEPSTRTRLSFETAAHRLGANVIGFADGANTSAKKGETLADTARIISGYADAIVVRHNKDGAARVMSEFSSVPVVNAGDGTNQHPSQTLLDLITIFETQGRLEHLHIVLVGDLKYGRTVHSLAQALSHWDNTFYFVAPPQLAMPDYICEELAEKGRAYHVVERLEDALALADIVYMTRVQRERFDEQEFLKIKGLYVLKAAMLTEVKASMRIMHPLPRVDEIATDVDVTVQAYYFEQAQNGVFARQALLAAVLNEELPA